MADLTMAMPYDVIMADPVRPRGGESPRSYPEADPLAQHLPVPIVYDEADPLPLTRPARPLRGDTPIFFAAAIIDPAERQLLRPSRWA